MSRDDINNFLRERPFRPFRLLLSNDKTYEIRHPELAFATLSSVVLGIPATNSPQPVADYAVHVSLMHVVQIEHIAATPTASAG